jgi:hypothetical protein
MDNINLACRYIASHFNYFAGIAPLPFEAEARLSNI